jgi:hypothetical protein
MDPWVVAQVLDTNLSSTGFQGQAVVHTTRVEVLLYVACYSLSILSHASFTLFLLYAVLSTLPCLESVQLQKGMSSPVGEETLSSAVHDVIILFLAAIRC